MMMKASAIAHSNVALIKYWGRSLDQSFHLNIPSNDSVSMTKCGISKNIRLQTHTTIEFSDAYAEDTAILNGNFVTGRNMERILKIVNPLRKRSKVTWKFKMVSQNDYPTQAGLASSASGFAALANATAHALSLDLTKKELSRYARLGSGSAARSIHGGFVYWHKGHSHETSFAEQICGPDEFNMNVVIAIVNEERKAITSDVGHRTAHTSPFNSIRIDKSQQQAKEIRRAILDDDFSKVGKLSEENCKYMHFVMMTSEPPLYYWQPETLRLMKLIHKIRGAGLECYFTIDAGPNVHFLSRPDGIYELRKELENRDFVNKTILARQASDSLVIERHLF